jgi:hypothetical protein
MPSSSGVVGLGLLLSMLDSIAQSVRICRPQHLVADSTEVWISGKCEGSGGNPTPLRLAAYQSRREAQFPYMGDRLRLGIMAMTGNVDAFNQAMDRMESAERRGAMLVSDLQRRIGPLLANWKNCYPVAASSDVVPPILMRVDQGGPAQRIDVADFPAIWPQLQMAITQYAEARHAAIAAYEILSLTEKSRLKTPPWILTDGPRMGGGQVELDPNHFRPRRR